MIKLNAGFSRKIGEPNYGSRGASVNVDLELESHLIGEPEALTGRIRQLFDLARRSVDDELNGGPVEPGNGRMTGPPPNRSNGHARTPAGTSQPRAATASQVRAIRSICQRLNINPDRLANERYRVNGLEALSLTEASALIDELKASQNANGNGGGR